MGRFAQAVLSVLSLSPWRSPVAEIPLGSNLPHLAPPTNELSHTKSIAIVGGGSGGVAVLKTLLDLPYEIRSNWEIVLFEQRRDVGGVWLEDLNEPQPPVLPETPLYPLLHTNTPHPTMTYPGTPFPPNTPLFPSHEYIQQYHADYVSSFNLSTFIRLNHTVHCAYWKGNETNGAWDVEIHYRDGFGVPQIQKKSFDHLVVANGHNHYPRTPSWNGTREWLAGSPPGRPIRDLEHSIFYRGPERYSNRTVLIVGAGASGRDAALQVGASVKTYLSVKQEPIMSDELPVTFVPPISHFNSTSVIFTDGTALRSIDSIILATGYEFLVPFLSQDDAFSGRSPELSVDPVTSTNSTTAKSLTSNTRYIFPLWEHIFSLSPQLPPTALSFVGLPVLIANCPSDMAQAILIAHALANPSILPPRDRMLTKLVQQENMLRERGYDPYLVGHKMVGGDDDAQAYQNKLVRYLKEKGAIPDDGKDYVEQWRRDARNRSYLLRRAWKRIEESGESDMWLNGVVSEDDWANLLGRLAEWQQKWEDEHGIDLRNVVDPLGY